MLSSFSSVEKALSRGHQGQERSACVDGVDRTGTWAERRGAEAVSALHRCFLGTLSVMLSCHHCSFLNLKMHIPTAQ